MNTSHWAHVLDLDFLREEFPDWIAAETADADVPELFLEHGLPILAPVKKGYNFDADYFIEMHPRWEGCDPVDCYRAWLFDHSGEAISAGARMAGFRLPGTSFPSAFPWRDYASLRPSAGANRWSALEHFIDEGFRDFGEKLTYGEGAQDFLVSLARRYSERDDRLALKAFDLALSFGPLASPTERQHLADAYLRMHFASAARQIYQALVDEGKAEGWTVRNLYFSCIAVNQGAATMQALLKTAPALKDDPIWRRTAEEMVHVFFDAEMRKSRALYSRGEDASAVQTIDAMAELLCVLMEALSVGLDKPETFGRRIVMVTDQSDAATRHYRIEQKAALIDSVGGTLDLVGYDLGALGEVLKGAGAVIFLEAAATPQSLRALQLARQLDVPIFYEAYSPGFDTTCAPPPKEAFAGFLTSGLHTDLKINVALRRAFAQRCDFGIASTDSIAQRLEPIVQGQKAWVLPDRCAESVGNVVSDKLVEAGEAAVFLESPRFFYLTPEDQGVGAALFACLAQVEGFHLTVSGYVNIDPRFDVFDDRIIELGPISVVGRHLSSLGGRRINIALTVDQGDDAASSASWRAASALGIPSIIDTDCAAAAKVHHDKDALVSRTPSDWLKNLTRLLHDPALGSKIGKQAERRLLEDQSRKKDAKLAEEIFFPGRSSAFAWLGAIKRSPHFLR